MATSNVEMGKYDFTPKSAGFAIGKPLSEPLSELPPQTLSIDCETIILNKRDLEISFKLESAKMENFNRLTINGINFEQKKLESRETAEWKMVVDDFDDGKGERELPHCSKCKRGVYKHDAGKYCPFCGATMINPMR